MTTPIEGEPAEMVRIGNTEMRALGGGWGCLGMILFSIIASVLLTVFANLILR